MILTDVYDGDDDGDDDDDDYDDDDDEATSPSNSCPVAEFLAPWTARACAR